MKKFLRTLMLTAAMLLPFASQAQNTLTVADGTTTNSYVPIYGLWADAYLRCQTIYSAGEIASSALSYDMTGGTISSITYYMSSPASEAWTGTWEVKLMEVPSTTLSAFVDMTGATTVYTGSLDGTVSPMTITFTTPYTYQGGNLLIEVSQTTSGNYKSCSFYGITSAAASWQGYNSSAWANITGSVQNFIPKTTFTFTGGSMITCRPVQNVAIVDSMTTSTDITLSWIDTLNTGATFSVYAIDAAGVATLLQSNITTNTYTATGLNANTQYTFGVEANCSATDAGAMQTVTGRTACGVEDYPWSENFDYWTSKSQCWTFMSGAFSGTPTVSSSAWNLNSSYGSDIVISGKALTMNVYSTNRYWAVTPYVNITSSDAMFSVDVAVAGWSSATTNYDSDDTLALAITTDGSTYTTLMVLDGTQLNALSGTYTTLRVPLTAYVGQTARFAIFAGSSASGGDNRIAIDNVTVDAEPSCYPVTNLTVSGVTSTDATLNWVGDADSYTIYDMSDTSVIATVTDTFYTFTSLDAMTQYTIGVGANCSNDESEIVTVSFATACNAMALPFTETFEATSSSIACWTTDGPGSWTVGTGDYSTSTGAFEGSTNARITHGTSGNATKLISPVLDNVTDGLKLDFAYVMRAWSSDLDELHVYSRADADSAWQQVAAYTDAAATWTVANVIIPGTVYQVAFEFVDGYGYGLGIDSVVFSEMTGNYCYAVSNLTAGNATANSIDLSWLDANNSGASYTVYNMADTSVVASNVSGNNYTVSGLNASTAYTFGVVANCSATSASDIVTVSAATGCVGGSCNIYVYAQDSYGDGWNGATINFLQNGVNVDSYSMDGQDVSNTVIYDTAAVSVCAGAPISLNWTSGSWDSEITVEIANSFGDVLFTASGSDLTGEFLVLDSCSAVATVDTTTGDVTITFAVNDATMGTTVPAPGTYTYALDSVLSVTAVPAAGYHLTDWEISMYIPDYGNYTTSVGTNDLTITDTVSEDFDGITITAIFAQDVNCPDSVTIPFFEGFETGIDCWSMVNTAANTGAAIFEDYAYQDSGLFYFVYNTNPPQYLITPRLAGTGNGVEVEFYYQVMQSNYPESFQIGYSTTTNDTSAFVWGTEQTNLTNTTYAYYSEVLAASGIKYVAIKYTANDMYYLFIDNFEVHEAPSCFPVSNLNVTASTSTSISLSWTDANTGATYTLYNMADTSVIASNISGTSYTVTGLATATTYTFGVVANCSATDVSNIVTIDASTECDVITVYPYTQDFSVVPACWSAIDADGDGYGWELLAGAMHSASYDNNDGVLTPDNWLITPQFQLTANTNYEVTWNANPQDASWPSEHYGLYVSTGYPDTSAFVLIQEWTLTSAGHTPVINLSSYAGQTIYLAFRHWNCSDMFQIAIDNFELREAAGANQVTVTLTQNNPMYGSVSGSGVYTIGDNVTVTATPADDYVFSRWADVTGATVSTANPYTFVATTDVTLQAIFVSNTAQTYTITVDVNDSTMGYATGSGEYTSGDVAVLTAYPYEGYRFVNWTWNDMPLGTDNPMSMTVTTNSSAYPIVANFEPDTAVVEGYLTLITAVNNPNMGTITPAPGTHQYVVGDVIEFSATAYEGYHYESVDVALSFMGITLMDTTVTEELEDFDFEVVEDLIGVTLSITVNFMPDQVEEATLTVNVNNANMGYVLINGDQATSYTGYIGEVVTLKAVANNGFHFDGWSDGQTSDTRTFELTEATNSITANFAQNQAIDLADMVSNLNVYPNPTFGVVTVDADDVVKVEVLDINGRLVSSFDNTNRVDLSSLTAGTYMLRIQTTNGTAVKRVIKK